VRFLKRPKKIDEPGFPLGASVDDARDLEGKGIEKIREPPSATGSDEPSFELDNEEFQMGEGAYTPDGRYVTLRNIKQLQEIRKMYDNGEITREEYDEMSDEAMTLPDSRNYNGTSMQSTSDDPTLQILKTRLARGEITTGEFEEMKNVIGKSNSDIKKSSMGKHTSNPSQVENRNRYIDFVKSSPSFRKGKWKDALKETDKMIKTNPNDSIAWYSKAMALMYLDRNADVIPALDKALSIDPNSSPALRAKGTILHLVGKTQEALATYNQALSIDPSYASILGWKARTFVDLGRYMEALQLGKQGSDLNAMEWNSWYAQALALSKLGSASGAAKYYQKTIEACDIELQTFPNPSALNIKAHSLDMMGRANEAKKVRKLLEKLG
jgi:tetratricopeptide (TPR) repeat protein